MKRFAQGIAALACLILLGLGPAHAAPPVVEIVAMPHPPVQAALQSLRGWLAAQGDKVKLREIDSESADSAKHLQVVVAERMKR